MLQHPVLCHQPLPEPILPPSTLHLAAHTLLSLQLPHPALSPGSSQRSACPALPFPPDTVHVGSGLFCCCSLLLGPALGKWGWLLLLEYKVTALRSILPSPCCSPPPWAMWLCRDSRAGPLGWLSPTPVTLQCGSMGMFMSRICSRNSAQHSTHPTLVGPGQCQDTSRTLPGLPGPWQGAWLSQAGDGCRGPGMPVGI